MLGRCSLLKIKFGKGTLNRIDKTDSISKLTTLWSEDGADVETCCTIAQDVRMMSSTDLPVYQNYTKIQKTDRMHHLNA